MRGYTLLLCAALFAPVAMATKTSDAVTCGVAWSTETFEFSSPVEFARFGLLVCRLRGTAARAVNLELTSHGPLTVGFFDVPDAVSADKPDGVAEKIAVKGVVDWESLLRELRAQQKLKMMGGGEIKPGTDFWIGYAATLRADRLVKTDADIMYDAGSAETEKLLTVSLEHSPSQWEKFVDAVPATVISFATNLFGVVAGAILSYFFFHRQQRVLAKLEEQKLTKSALLDEQKLFRQRKLEKTDLISQFFRDYKQDYKTDADDLKTVRGTRRMLVDLGLYSILPLAVIDAIDGVCTNNGAQVPPRGKTLDELLRDNFREFIVD